jgi:hypothetical protein
MSRSRRSPAPFLALILLVLAGCGGNNSTQPENQAPVADAGADFVVGLGGTARLIGHGVDPNPGDALTYAWAFVSRPDGSAAVLVNPNLATATFIPDLTGSYVARLTVSDGKAAGTDEVTITARTAHSSRRS